VRYSIVRASPPDVVLDLQSFARAAGLHPSMIQRLVTLGLLEPRADPSGDLWFRPAQLATVGRILRLRAGLSVNYASVGLVLDLLDRIAELESALRHAEQKNLAV
jgi:DNA-binding transcriptional MerR regulator